MDHQHIISKLPYAKPFLFVDAIVSIDENRVEGHYTFNENLDFYNGHFPENPVTPGVILTETMAQIGVVCLGIFLVDNFNPKTKIAMTATAIEFLKPVFPKQKVTVKSEKIYFRFGKLKCSVKMFDETGDTVCLGTIAGMITNHE